MAHKIAFLLHNDELVLWLQEEVKAFPYEALFGTNKPADAYVVFTERGEVEEFLPIVEGQMFAWFGEGAEQAATKKPFMVEGDWEKFTADDLVNVANEMHEALNKREKKDKPKLLRRTEVKDEPARDSREDQESFAYDTEDVRVIAVGGHGGASFVAWNLAAVTHLPLMEGRATGSLSKWTGDGTSVRQALEETLPYGTVFDGPLPKSIIGKRVIVDTGPDPRHPVFEHARIRIWVTTLDPAQSPIPERVKVVVNRVPTHVPFDPREVVKADISLEVPDAGLDALLSLFTHIPWIAKQGQEIQEQWRSLVETKRGGTQTWDIGW